MADSYEFLKAHFDRILAKQIAARVELLEAAQEAVAFLGSVEWNDTMSETDAANVRHRLEDAISQMTEQPGSVGAVDPVDGIVTG